MTNDYCPPRDGRPMLDDRTVPHDHADHDHTVDEYAQRPVTDPR